MTKPEHTEFATLVRRRRDLAGLTQEESGCAGGTQLSQHQRYRAWDNSHALPGDSPADGGRTGSDGRGWAEFLAGARPPANEGAELQADTTGLPVETSMLLGREREEAEAVHVIRFEGVRLLTLTGLAV